MSSICAAKKTKKNTKTFFVVIPAMNEELHLGDVLKQTKKITKNIIVIDDGSTDKTFSIAREHQVTVLRHLINLGKGAALKTGCQKAFQQGADFVIIMDSDGQHDPNELPKFIKEIQKPAIEVIIGCRNFIGPIPLIRVVVNKMASWLIKTLFQISVNDLLCGYRAFTKRAFRLIAWESSRYGVETEMVAKIGIKSLPFKTIPIKTIYHDFYKGVTIFDAIKILFSVIKWKIVWKS